MNRMFRLPEVISVTGLSRSAVYAQIKAGLFPRPVKLSARAVAWPLEDIERWRSVRIAEARTQAS